MQPVGALPPFPVGGSHQMAAEYLRRSPGFVQTSPDAFEATHQTVQYMCSLVAAAASDPLVQAAAKDARRFSSLYRSVPGQIWSWAKRAVKFVHHQDLLEKWLGRGDELQLLISPDVLLRMAKPIGDCAVFTTLICSLLDQAGLDWEIVTVAVDPRQPGVFSHVYPRAVYENVYRVPLDASHGKYPGWEVPRRRVSRLQVWDKAGNPIEDQDSGYRGLHGVNMQTGFGYASGLGQDDGATATDLPTIDPGTTYGPTQAQLGISPDGTSATSRAIADSLFAQYGSTQTAPPAGGSSAAANAIASLLGQFGKAIAPAVGQAIAPTTQYIRNADGSISLITPGSQSTLTSSLFSGSISSSSLLMLGGLAVGAMLLISMFKK